MMKNILVVKKQLPRRHQNFQKFKNLKMSDNERSPQPKKVRQAVDLSEYFLFRNHLAIFNCLKYIYQNPDEDPERFYDEKKKTKALRSLFSAITSHASDSTRNFEKLKSLYLESGRIIIMLWAPII